MSYAGDGLDAFEQQTRARMPGWAARDLRLMARGGFQRHGMATKPGDLDRLAALLGRPVRSHRDFARGTLDQGRGA